jgi:hypothetical protein
MGRPKGSKNKNKNKNKAADAPKRKYTRRAPKVVASAGGTRSGAGRKSAEVHFAQLNVKVDAIMARMGIAAAPASVPEPAPAPVAVAPISVNNAVPVVPEPVKRKPGRPRKLAVAPPAAEAIEKVLTRNLPADPVVVIPTPVFAPPAPVQLVMQAPLAPPFAAQPTQVPQQPVYAPPVMQAPVTFTPPAPIPVQPGYIGVQPLPVQPTANGAPDFDAQFNALPNLTPGQPR